VTDLEGAPPAPVAATKALLEVDALSVDHGQLRALTDVSLRVGAGELYAIIGANGAGKSTLLRAIAGLDRAAAGTVRLDGTDITKLSAERRVMAGIALVPEGRRLFNGLTLEENLLVGGHRKRPGPWSVERVFALFPWMAERRKQQAVQLSGGEQQAVAIGRALMTNPRVLLLDEVSLGLAPVVVRRVYSLLPELLDSGVTILVVEQDVSQAMRVCSHVQCLLEGRTTLQGRPAEFTAEQIEQAYFGLVRRHAAA
jgi:branched-chain amino acid transport system ATP-binding protein